MVVTMFLLKLLNVSKIKLQLREQQDELNKQVFCLVIVKSFLLGTILYQGKMVVQTFPSLAKSASKILSQPTQQLAEILTPRYRIKF
jgi:hypothetical protein